MDWSQFSITALWVVASVFGAEASNGWTDAPCATSAAVATGVLSSRRALWITVIGNFAGVALSLVVGASVAKTIGTGIVRPGIITTESIGIAMVTTIVWAAIAARLRLPVSKTHSLLAALAGIGYLQGGINALLPESGNWHDSGWVKVGIGMVLALLSGSAISWFLARVAITLDLSERVSEYWWKKIQLLTVCGVASGHGFNDGLKYVGILTLVLYKARITDHFHVMPGTIVLCAFVMGLGTLLGGWGIHRRLDRMVNDEDGLPKKTFKPYMGVASELTAGFLIWQTGWLGIPTSTTHATVSAMAGAKSAAGRVHISSVVRVVWGWVITYAFCLLLAYWLTAGFLHPVFHG